jgi:glycosyltransferase involved in cell wall biosynthesis
LYYSGTFLPTVSGPIGTPNSLPVIAIDYTPAYEQGGGIGRYVRELVAALAHIDLQTKYRLFVGGATSVELPPPVAPNFEWRPTPLSPRWLARIWHRARLPIPVEFLTGSANLYHATDFVLPPTCPSTHTLLTVHDLSFVRVPETASPPLKAYLDKVVPQSVARADHVLADSQATKDDLVALYGTSSEKVTVLLSGVDAGFRRVDDSGQLTIRSKYGLQSPFLFSIGTIQPRKNYGRLIEALAILRQDNYDLDLVIAGGQGWLGDPIYQTVRNNNLEEHVHFVGFVEEADLPALYSAAECLAFPSLYEGFGFPVLEAMACGTSVVTSNVSSLPEVAGDAALMVDPYDTEAIADAIRKIIEDSSLKNDLIERGYGQVGRFSWVESAQKLRQIYSDML